MIRWSAIAWSRLGAAALLGGGLAACAQPASPPAAEQAPTQAIAAPGGEAGESAGGEAGEAGASAALSGLSGEPAVAFNRWRLAGFLAIAAAEAKDKNYAEAGALIGQGALEVFPTPPAGLDLTVVKALDAELSSGAPKGDALARIEATRTGLIASAPPTADTVRRLVSLAAGLYKEADGEAGVDPLEYQHSLGAVMAAESALAALQASGNASRYAAAQSQLKALRALYTGPRAGETIAPHRTVSAQASRVELELSGL